MCGVMETVMVSTTCAEYESILLAMAPKLHTAQLFTSEVEAAMLGFDPSEWRFHRMNKPDESKGWKC